MPKGITLTPEQQAARRSEIVDIALRLIAENGFQKTSMREIADLAKMGKSSLYDFFKTKDEIAVYAMEKKFEEIIEQVHRIIDNEPLPELCLRKIMHNQLKVPHQYRIVLMWLHAESDYLEEEYRKRLKTIRYEYHNTIKTVIEGGVAKGVFRKTDSDLVVRLLINSMLSIVYTSRPSASELKMLDETINIFLHGIMNEGGEKNEPLYPVFGA